MLYRGGFANEEEKVAAKKMIESGLTSYQIGQRTGVSPRVIESLRPLLATDDKPTTAETIAYIFGNDGQCFVNKGGHELPFVCEAVMSDKDVDEHNSGNVRFNFEDGSAIVILGDGWDIGFDAEEVKANTRKRFAWPDAWYSDDEQ